MLLAQGHTNFAAYCICSAQSEAAGCHVLCGVEVKAFDRVRRDLLLERCRELGIHGEFLALLVKMYDRIYCRVAVDGTLGDPIHTTTQ
jgi:hypothetical protein